MSEENAEVIEAPETGAENTEAQDQGPSVEDRARAMGWRPEAEFKGDKARWIDADTFVKRGEEILPIVQANNKAMERALNAANKEVAKLKDTLDKFSEHHSKTEARAYERALKDLKSEQALAVEANDLTRVQEITDEIADLKTEATKGPKAPEKQPEPEGDEERDEWVKANPWFDKEPAMRGAAIEIGEELAKAGKFDFAEITRRIKAEFPHKFTNPRRSQPAPVDGAPAAGADKGGKSYSDLPPDAKAMCDDFVKQKLLTREAYVRDYFA